MNSVETQVTSFGHSDKVTAFRRDGYVVIRQLIAPEVIHRVAHFADTITRETGIIDPLNLRCRYKIQPETGASLLDALDPVLDLSPTIEEIAKTPTLLQTLAQLYGEPALLFKDKLIFKPSGSPGYPWHQDFIAWPFFPESFTSVAIAIDTANETNGCIEVVRNSHRQAYLSPRDGDFHDLAESAFAAEERLKIPLAAGDAVIFGCYLVHGSDANTSAHPRRHLYLSYNKQSDGGQQRDAHYRYFHSWLRRRYSEYGAKNCFFR